MPTYTAGTATVDILPSLKKFHSTIRSELKGITAPDVQIGVDTKNFTRQLGKLKAPTVQLKVEANTQALKKAEADLAAAEKRIQSARYASADATAKMDIAEKALAETRKRSGEGSSRAAAAELRLAQAKRANTQATLAVSNAESAYQSNKKNVDDAKLKLQTDVDTGGMAAKLQAFAVRASKQYQIKMGVDPDLGGAQARLAVFKATASRLVNVSGNVSLDTGAALAKMTALSAAGATIGTGIAGGVGVAGAALTALPAAIAAVLGPVAALTAGIAGVPAAFQAFSQAEDQAAQNTTATAKAQASAARQVVSARQQVGQAQTQLSRAYEDASAAQVSAARRVSDAERQVITAERARLQAQRAVTQAVEDARRAQQDLQFQLAGGALAERQAVLDLADAQQDLDSARASGASGKDLERVKIAYEQQVLALDELRVRNSNLAADKKVSDAAGVQGSDQVTEAQQRLADSSQGVADAQQGVRDAQVESARTQVQSQRSIADAQLQVAQAQQQLTVALQDSGTVGAAATDKINAAMAKLSPAAQQFIQDIRSLSPEFDNLKTTAQEALFQGLGPAFADFGKTVLPQMAGNLGVVNTAINGVTKDMLGFLSTGDSAASFQQLFAGIGQVVTAVGPVLQTLVKLFLELATAAMPGIVALVQAVGTIGTALMTALQPLIDSGAITQAITLIAGLISAIAPILAQVVVIAIQLINALGPSLIGIVQALAPVFAVLGQILLQAAPIIGDIALMIAQALLPIMQALAPVIAQLLPVISTLVSSGLQILIPLIQAAAQIFLAFMPAIQAVAGIIAGLVPIIAPLITQLASGLLPIITALTPVVTQLATLLAQTFSMALQALIPLVLQILNALMPLIPTLAGIITQIVSGLLPIMIPLAEMFVGLIAAVLPLLPPLLELVTAIFPALLGLVGALMPIITLLAGIFTDVLAIAISNVILPILNLLVGAVKTAGGIFSWLYDKIIKPIWDLIAGIIQGVWDKTLKPVFDFISGAVKAVADAFTAMGDTIKGIWAAIKSIVHAGIQGIVDIVYNNGIRALANAVIKYIPGVDYLPELKIPAFSEGTVLPGYAPGRDTVPAMLSPGEAVLVPELVRVLGAQTILAANAAAMRGRGYSRGGIVGTQRFADGGLVSAATTGAGVATPVTVDPAALAALGEVAAAVTAQFTQLADILVSVVTPAIDGVVTIVIGMSTTIRTIAIPAVLAYEQQTTATTGVVVTQWTVITAAVNTSVNGQTTALTALQTALTATRSAIAATADWAVSQFDRIRAAAADPIRWVIQFPINTGLIGAWNTLDAQFAFNRRVNPIPIGFNTGGRVFGSGTGTSDSIDARLSPGEFVIREAIAKRMYPFLSALNGGVPEALQATGYAQGGIVADTGSQLNAALARGAAFAQAQDGKPYIWGGVGPEGYDCSGFMSAITNTLRGENPHRRLGVARSQPWPGFVPGLSSAFATGFSDAHTAGTLAGVNVESGGSSSRVKFGIGAAGADDRQFGGHASLPLVGGRFVPGGGGVDFAELIGPYFADTYRMLGQVATLFAGNLMGHQAGGMGTQAADGAKNAAISALTAFSAVTATAGSPEVTAAVRAVAARFGWGDGPEWNALSQLISHESGWNPAAANPTSSARGLFQKMTGTHGPLEPTIAGQAEWGLNYIRSRPDYGSPSKAWAAWQSRSPHWYDKGGMLGGVGWFYKGTNEPERVLSGAQTRSFDTLVANVSRSDFSTSSGAEGDRLMRGEFELVDDSGFLGRIRGVVHEENQAVGARIARGTR